MSGAWLSWRSRYQRRVVPCKTPTRANLGCLPISHDSRPCLRPLNVVLQHPQTIGPPNPRHSALRYSSVLQIYVHKFQPVPISYTPESATAPNFPPAQVCYSATDKRAMSVTLQLSKRLLKTFSVLDYDLVRIYHPDSPVARKYPADTAQTRFQSISKAYDLMRGKSAITGEVLTNRERHADPARFRPKAARRRPHFDETTGDERWKERILFGATVLVSLVYVATCSGPADDFYRPSLHLWCRPPLLAIKPSFRPPVVLGQLRLDQSTPWPMKRWLNRPGPQGHGDAFTVLFA
jgi:hypothetical protein